MSESTQLMLLDKVSTDQKQGLLDHRWLVRLYLSKYKNIGKTQIYNQLKKKKKISDEKNDILLFSIALLPFKYIYENRSKIDKDHSLHAITDLCIDLTMINDPEYEDKQLTYLSQTFNRLISSSRTLYLCYDCGTVARGIFFSLIKAYRGEFRLTDCEIKRIANEYYMDRYTIEESLKFFHKNLVEITTNCLFMCALDFGNKFGHIYIIEKAYINGKNREPRYRIYQSCQSSYLLIDYIEFMDYANHINKGIDIDQHFKDLSQILTTVNLTDRHIESFVKWFCFYPMASILPNDIKKFASTYVQF